MTDRDYDNRAAEILGATFVDEDREAMFEAWIARQSALACAAAKSDSRDELEALRMQQDIQRSILDQWREHMWPQDFIFHIDAARLATMLAYKALANRELAAARAAMETALTSARWILAGYPALRKKKQQLQAENSAAYARILQLSEEVRRTPGLFICDDAYRKAQFLSYPDSLHDSFSPIPCPDWVDAGKAERGFRIWREQMPGCVFVLFTHSLPACYLDASGIPLLYRSERLLKQAFLAQRMYETGFFVKDVMDEGGVTLLEDNGAWKTLCFAAAVQETRPELELDFETGLDPFWIDAKRERFSYWELRADPAIRRAYEARKLRYAKEGAAALPSPTELRLDTGRLLRHCLEPDVKFTARRLWGPGILTATKVRYLHASMRYLARSDPNVMKFAEPINQEDKVFTLLTLGYLIPAGLEKLGAVLPRDDKNAFLHGWKVIGHVMGVDADLLTDDWDDAKALYEKIKSRQRAASERGTILTNALCTLIEDLMPEWLPWRASFGPIWIRDQLGDEDAKLILDSGQMQRSQAWLPRAAWALIKLLLRIYFVSRYYVFDRTSAVRAFFSHQLSVLGTTTIECFQQTYNRQRFEMFASERGIEGAGGPTPLEEEGRLKLRRRAYDAAMLGVLLIVLLPTLFWLGAASALGWFLFDWQPALRLAQAMFALGVLDIIGVAAVEGRIDAALRRLAYTPESKALL